MRARPVLRLFLVIRKLFSVIETLKARTGLGLTMFQPRLNRSLDDHRYRPRQLGAAAESLLRRIKRHDSLYKQQFFTHVVCPSESCGTIP
jgi:hypothetical protein